MAKVIVQGDELYHFGFWKKHKYVEKIKITPKYTRYFYSRQEYLSYLNKIKKFLGKEADKLDFSKITLSDFLSKSKNAFNSGLSFINNIFGNTSKIIGSNKTDYEDAKEDYLSKKDDLDSKISELKRDEKEIDKKIEEVKSRTADDILKDKIHEVTRSTGKAIDFVEALMSKPLLSVSTIGVGGVLASVANAGIKKLTENNKISKLEKKYSNQSKEEKKKFEEEKNKEIDELNKKKKEKTNEIEKLETELKTVEDTFSIAQKVRDDFLDKMARQQEKSNPKSFDELKKLTKKYTDAENQELVNPYYDEGPEWKINCSYCSMAYEFRKRGYDVEADDYHDGKALDEDLNTIDEVYSWYQSTEYEEQDFFDKVLNKKTRKKIDIYRYTTDGGTLGATGSDTFETAVKEKYPVGSRGQFIVYWAQSYGGGGHSIVWEYTNSGNILLRDCQTNKTYTDPYDVLKYASDLYFFRTDNAELTDEALKAIKNK